MKILNKHLKLVARVLAFFILFQSCVAYKDTPNSIDEIVKSRSKVSLVTTDNRKHKFKKIEKRNNKYFGIKSINNRKRDMLLFPNDIKSLKVYDGIVTTLLTIFFSTLVIPIIGAASGAKGF